MSKQADEYYRQSLLVFRYPPAYGRIVDTDFDVSKVRD
jgi:hypothetical protein